MTSNLTNHHRRVVITGMGAATSIGVEIEQIWNAILEGQSGISQIKQFDSNHFPVKIGSEVDIEKLKLENAEEIGPYLSRSAHFGIWAMDRAWEDARLRPDDFQPRRAGVCIGASTFPVMEDNLGDLHEIEDSSKILEGEFYNAAYYLEWCRRRPELLSQRDMPSISTLFSYRQGLTGVSMTVQTACASATQAIGESFQMIRHNKADLMVSGGTDSMVSIICVTGFTLLGALSPFQGDPKKASRPFDLKRDGFVIGEGSGILILEELEHALRRGAPIYGEIIGYGSSCDGYRFTDVHPTGRGAIACMSAALRDANVCPEEVDYINAHGTSTVQNDKVETHAVKQVFGEHAYQLAMSSSKSQIGHLICAAGGIEMILTTLAVHTGTISPTINMEYADPECDLDYVPNESRRADVGVALSNSFGFGGQNGTLVIRRWDN
jgi:3-oxoacyl-[acyl-carrier-protein] synthase II